MRKHVAQGQACIRCSERNRGERKGAREGGREIEGGGGGGKRGMWVLPSSPCQALCRQNSPPPPMPMECLSLIEGWLPFFNHKE